MTIPFFDRYYAAMKTIVSDNGQIEIPAEFLRADAVQPGQECEIERVGRREYRIVIGKSESTSANSNNPSVPANLISEVKRIREEHGLAGKETISAEAWEVIANTIADDR